MTNEAGDVWVTYNGEIYNFQELRAEKLLAAGHRFRSETDSEVVVHAYEQWGEASFARFDGMFAIAIWDEAAADDPGSRSARQEAAFLLPPAGQAAGLRVDIAADHGVAGRPRNIDQHLSIYEYIKIGYLHAPRSLLANRVQSAAGALHGLRPRRRRARRLSGRRIASREPPKFRSEEDLLDQLDDAMRAPRSANGWSRTFRWGRFCPAAPIPA